jgi:hypothetical protein
MGSSDYPYYQYKEYHRAVTAPEPAPAKTAKA